MALTLSCAPHSDGCRNFGFSFEIRILGPSFGYMRNALGGRRQYRKSSLVCFCKIGKVALRSSPWPCLQLRGKIATLLREANAKKTNEVQAKIT